MMNKILVGACIRQDPVVLGYYLRSLQALKAPPNTELRFGFINDGGEEQLAALGSLSNVAIVLPAEPRPADALYGVTQQTHLWNVSTFEHLARQKQRLLDYAKEAGYSHVFLVDSDLLLEPTTLQSLWYTGGSIANAVFWTQWNPEVLALPQCWLSHPYTLAGLGLQEHEYITALAERQVLRCLGGGACTLIPVQALERGVHYSPRLPNLPVEGMWQGEDRTFAILAQRQHVRQLADGWPDIFHAYHPAQRQEAVLNEVWSVLSAPRQQRAGYGDQISLHIEPLEDASLIQALQVHPELACVRGRLGQLKLAPELEVAAVDMGPGEERMLDVQFPPWYELTQYRGQKRMLRLRMLDIKPYSYAPVLADVAFAGVNG